MRRTGFIALILSLPLAAATITLPSVNTGFYQVNGVTVATSGYFTGVCAGCVPVGEYRAYNVFSLTAGLSTITAATLSLPFTGYNSNDPSETLALFDVTTSIAALTSGVGSVAIFTDLGTGTILGSVVVPPSAGPTVNVVFNAAGLAYLNSKIGSSAGLGLALTSLAFGATDEALFNNSAKSHPTLTITTNDAGSPTPEPGTLPLLLCGIGLAVVAGRKVSHTIA